jgi:hypothetical protein
MGLLIVGLRGEDAGDSDRTVDLGAAGTVHLKPQGLQSGGTHWYSAQVDDTEDVASLVSALQDRPEVDSAYLQPPQGPPG